MFFLIVCSFSGFDHRMYGYVDHMAWCMKQIPLMKVSGPIPLPTKRYRVQVLKSPFKYGKARETWERRTHKRLIMYETDDTTHRKFMKFLNAMLEPVVAVKVTEVSFHKVDNFYRKELFDKQRVEKKQ